MTVIPSLILTLLSLSAHAEPGQQDCLIRAANEFEIPVAVLSVIEQNPIKSSRTDRYGPMALNDFMIGAAYRVLGIHPDAAKNELCQNYRVAAWHIADIKRHANNDLWSAVARYYAGNPLFLVVTPELEKTLKHLKQSAAKIEQAHLKNL